MFTEVITSDAMAFPFPIKPSFSAVLPLIFILLEFISQNLLIVCIIFFEYFFILGFWAIIFISMLLIEKFLDLINSITFLSKIVDLIFLYFLFLSGNNFPKYDFDDFYLSKDLLDEFDKSKTCCRWWKLHLNIAYKQYRVWRFRHFILHRMNDEENGEIKFITRYPVYDSRHLFVVHRKKYDMKDEDEDYHWATKFKIQLIDSEDLEFGSDPITSLKFNAKQLFLLKKN